MVNKNVTFMDMAPMAATISTTKEHGLIFSLCLFKHFIAPRVPIYWMSLKNPVE